jgi:hypothetical protein
MVLHSNLHILEIGDYITTRLKAIDIDEINYLIEEYEFKYDRKLSQKDKTKIRIDVLLRISGGSK